LESRSSGESGGQAHGFSESLAQEITFLEKKKRILSVMLMESLKADNKDVSLFKCAELGIIHEHGGIKTNYEKVQEFFTGFIPLIAYVVLEEKFCEYTGMDRQESLSHFVGSFIVSHIDTQEA
jgi:hypothetical protein